MKESNNPNGRHDGSSSLMALFDEWPKLRRTSFHTLCRLLAGIWLLSASTRDLVAATQFYTVTMVPGWNALAYQLNGSDNRLGALIPNPPDQTRAAFFNGSGYTIYTFDEGVGEWDPPGNVPLRPGEGVLIQNPSAAPFSLTLSGQPNLPVLPLNIPPGQFRLVSRQTNGPATYEDIVGLPPTEGTKFYRLEPGALGLEIVTNHWDTFCYSNAAWSPSPPSLGVGVCAFIFAPAALAFTVTANAGAHGTVKPATANVAGGQNATCTAEPDIGYEVETWLVDNIAQPLPVNPTILNLNNIQANHAVVVNFKQAGKLDPRFPRPADLDKVDWVDANGQQWPWMIGLHANFGPPVYDRDFANMARPLILAGVPSHFAFGECFGGGMLQELEAIGRGGAIQFSGSSAVPWYDIAHYPGTKADDWVGAYINATVAGNRALLTSVLAWNNNPWNTDEFSQYRDSSPLVGGLKDPGPVGAMFDHTAAGVRKMAILWTGKAEFANPADGPPVDGPQIIAIWNKLVAFGYAAADIQVLYDNGMAPAGAPAGMMVAPAVNTLFQPNLRNAFQNVIDASMATNVQFFFLANDHGVAHNNCMPPGAWLIVPKLGTNYSGLRTNLWQRPPSTNVMRGLQNYGPDPYNPINGWATDPFYVSSPTITNQPQDVIANLGDTVTLTVAASGTAPIFYQWYCGTNVVPNRTNASMTITNLQTANMGSYFVICSNACNQVSSYPANITPYGLDWGDAPDPTYPTVRANNGARHVIKPGFHLGLLIDAEANGQPNVSATGDDIAGVADEDGVILPAALVAGGNALIRVIASAAGKLDAWIDFNSNGSWADAGEQIANATPLVAGLNLLNVPIPANATPVSGTYARFRFSSAGGLAFTGQADDGEVEDYRVAIAPPLYADLSLTKGISASSMAVGSDVTYTLVVSNAGPDAATSPALIDPLPPGLVLSSISASRGACSFESGTVLCDIGPLPSHGVATVTLSGTITNTGALTNQAFVTSSEIDSVTGNNRAGALAIVSNPPPVLDISVGGGVLQVCWPAFAPYVLESTASLSPPVIWTRDPAPSIVVGGSRCVTIVPTTGSRFFRLRLASATNEPPVALNDSYSGPHDQAVAVRAPGVLANDSDPDADVMTALVVESPQNGTIMLSRDGGFLYVPHPGFAGMDSWSYVVSDGTQVSAPATVTMAVTDSGPTVTDDRFGFQSSVAGAVVAPGVLRNDHDPDGDALFAILETSAAHGTLEFQSDGSFQYLPNPGFSGTDMFSYRASDGHSTSAVAHVTLVIHTANQAPVATDHNFSSSHDQLLAVPAPGVLAGASDLDGDPLSAVVETTTTNGTLVLESDGSFSYQPAEGFIGTDGFTYRVQDGAAGSGTAFVTLVITNGGGEALADTYYVKPGQALSNEAPGVLGNDGDPELDSLTAQLVSGPGFGTLTLNPDGSFVYQPNAGFAGMDSFRYTASDGLNVSPPTVVTIIVTNRPPAAQADTYGVCFGRVLNVTAPGVLLNDHDDEGDVLTATLVSPPAHGAVALAANGGFVYTPTAGYAGPDSFSYQASDGASSSATTLVSISVVTNCGLPEVVLDSYTTSPNSPLDVDVYSGLLANDEDPQNCALTAQLVGAASHGTVMLNPNGSFTYAPTPGFVGSDTFTYRIFNGAFYSEPVAVTINVAGSVPVSEPDEYSVHGTNVLAVGAPGVLENDVDQDDSDVLSAVLVSGPSHGTLFLDSWGSFTYTPTNRFLGTDGFTYRATDGQVTGAVTTVMIVVTNQIPLAGDDEETTVMNTPLSVAAPGLLANDTDDDGDDVLTVSVVSNPVHADSFSLQPDGSFTYTPASGFVGTDEFSYVASDGFTSSAPARVVITVTASAQEPNGFLPAGVGPLPELDLQAIGLSGGVPLLADSIRVPGPFGRPVPLKGLAPQWLDNGDGIINPFIGEHSHPYSYLRGAAFKGRVVFRTPNRNAFRGANGQYLPVFIRGRVNCNGGACFCNGAPCNVSVLPTRFFGMTPDRIGVGGTVYVDVQANVAFGIVDCIRVGIVWEFSVNGGPWRRCAPPGTLPNSPAGTSSHKIYVTWGVPTTSSMFETVVAYGSLRGRGVNNPNALLGRIWSNFAFKQARRVDGAPLTYYKNWNVPTIGGVPDLLWLADGRCGQWASFFINTLQAQGLAPANLRPSGVFAVGGRLCAPGAIFMVSKWNFAGPADAAKFPFPPWIALDARHAKSKFADGSVAYENIIQFNASDQFPPHAAAPVGLNWQYRWIGQPQVDYVGGAGNNQGQNNPTPRSLFTDHAIVRVAGRYFDPSYGTTYLNAQDMQNTAINGVCAWNWVQDSVFDISKGLPGRKGSWTYRVLFIKRTQPGDRPLIYFCQP